MRRGIVDFNWTDLGERTLTIDEASQPSEKLVAGILVIADDPSFVLLVIDRDEGRVSSKQKHWLALSFKARLSSWRRAPSCVICDVANPRRYFARLRPLIVHHRLGPAQTAEGGKRSFSPELDPDLVAWPRGNERIAPVSRLASIRIQPSEAGLCAQSSRDSQLFDRSDVFGPHSAALLARRRALKQPQRVFGRLPLLGLLSISVFGCNDSVEQFVFEAVIVDGEGGNPAAGTDATTLRVGIQEGELAPVEYEYPITEGDFEGVLEFRVFAAPTRVRVEIEGATTELLTAPPAFVPGASAGFMRVVTAAPSSCERVLLNSMEAPRAFFGMVQSGTFALLVGGASSTDAQVEYLDVLEWKSHLFEEEFSLSELGETRAASIDEGKILVLPSNASPFIFDMFDPTRRITAVILHNGAGTRSALVSVPGLGAMVIGGEVSGVPQSTVSLVEPDGTVVSLRLSVPRSDPQATALGMDVLVAGGDDDGTAEILLEGEQAGQSVAGVMDGVRKAGLLVGDGENRALWMGGVDADAALRQDTLRFDDCPSGCTASAGPAWPTARLAALQPQRSQLVIGGEGSSRVDEVRWSGTDVEISPLLDLNVPRAGAGGIVLESGAFIVAGGDDGVSVRDDFEFCVPAALEPL